jgi:KUP system potassium uptake protein
MSHEHRLRPAALLAVLGVVYGDIGTSPLYAFKASLDYLKGRAIEPWEVYGVLSLIFYSLITIVTIKYVYLVMRADNKGEGGILALTVLAQGVSGGRLRALLGVSGIVGVCLFFGDGLITPAISVLSAIEGVEVPLAWAKPAVIPTAIVIILGLFAIQARGTDKIGRLFGPVMLLWFTALAVLGTRAIIQHPDILWAVSPRYACALCWQHGWLAFLVLGAVVLSVTGAEALYADMGHFGALPIRLVWSFAVLPALLLNYFGQGALILSNAAAADNPFFLLCPDWLQLPMVGLATCATVIASQALITGAFSMSRQCVQLGILPRLTVRHTSADEEGQIFVPQINTLLATGVVILVLLFKSSTALASAYGIAVTATFLCTCFAAAVVFRGVFGWPRAVICLVFGPLFVLDAAFFAANGLKIIDGGYVPLLLAAVLVVMMTTWKRGRALMLHRIKQDSLSLPTFLARLPESSVIRVPGLAVFLTSNPQLVPSALLHNLKHYKVLHEQVVFVTIENVDSPRVGPERRAEVAELMPNIFQVTLRYGFMETMNLPRALQAIPEIAFVPAKASYFLARTVLTASKVRRMQAWRMKLFLAMADHARSATQAYYIPDDRVVELGVRIAI